MFLILVFFFLLLTLFIKVRIKDHMSLWVVMSFVCYWFISLCLSTFNPYTLYPVSERAYFLLILNVASFVLGFSCITIKPKTTCYNELSVNINQEIKRLIHSKLFIFFVLLCIIVCLRIYSMYAMYIHMGEGRVDAILEVANKGGGMFLTIHQFICPPLFYSICVLFSYMIFNYRNWKVILLLLLYIISYSIIGGGRTAFLVVFIGIFFIRYVGKEIFNRRNITISKNIYVLIAILFVISYFTMSWISAVRDGYEIFSWDTMSYGCDKLNKEFITYSLLPFRLFDYALEHNYLEKIGMQYGLSTLDGLNRYAYIILKKVGINISLVSAETTQYFQNTWIWVGKDIRANYAYTNAMYHYLDFAEFGVFIFPFIFGVLFRAIIKKFLKNVSLAGFFLLFYLYYVLVHSVFTWHIQKMYALGFVIITVFFLYKKRNIA